MCLVFLKSGQHWITHKDRVGDRSTKPDDVRFHGFSCNDFAFYLVVEGNILWGEWGTASQQIASCVCQPTFNILRGDTFCF